MLHFTLDLDGIDETKLTRWVERVKQGGCTYTTLQELMAEKEAVYWLHQECRKRQPPVEMRQEPQDYAKWLETFCTGPQACPALYYVLVQNGQKIGVSALVKTDTPCTLLCGFTGILPAFGGRGFALALKSHVLLAAKANGIQRVVTDVRADNPTMLALNRRLGFLPIPNADA